MNKGVEIGNIGCGKRRSRSTLDGRELREVEEDRGWVGEEGDQRAIRFWWGKKEDSEIVDDEDDGWFCWFGSPLLVLLVLRIRTRFLCTYDVLRDGNVFIRFKFFKKFFLDKKIKFKL